MADDEKLADLLNKLKAKGAAKRAAQFNALKAFLDLNDANFDFKRSLGLIISQQFLTEDGLSNFARWLTYKIMNCPECDSCALSNAVYERLWNSKADWYPSEFKQFYPDTMNSLAKTLEEYMLNHNDKFNISIPPREKMSAPKIAKDFKRKGEQDYKDIMESIESGLWEQWNIFAGNTGCLGNFTLVPHRFNSHRSGITQDYWDCSLILLANNDANFYGNIVWRKENFAKYINTFFLWDYVKSYKEGVFIPQPLFRTNNGDRCDPEKWTDGEYGEGSLLPSNDVEFKFFCGMPID